MLVLTENAIDFIESLTGGDAGLRLFVAGVRGGPLRVAVAQEPFHGDHVIDAQGVQIYVDAEAARRLAGTVLDASGQERSPRLVVRSRVPRRVRARRGPTPQLARWLQPGTWFGSRLRNDDGAQLGRERPVRGRRVTNDPGGRNMRTWFLRVRRGLSFANVMSMTAVFVALGGTSYAAVSLSHNSVGTWQIRTNGVDKSEIHRGAVAASEIRSDGVNRSEIKRDAVGPSELRGNAVETDEVADGSLEAADLSAAARTALESANAVSFDTASTAAGAAAGGNAKGIVHTALGTYTVDFGQDVSGCRYSATIGGVKTGTTIEQPAPGALAATASPSTTDATEVVVKTFDAGGTALDTAFHLLLTC